MPSVQRHYSQTRRSSIKVVNKSIRWLWIVKHFQVSLITTIQQTNQYSQEKFEFFEKLHLIFSNEFTAFNRTSTCKNLLKKNLSNLCMNVTNIPTISKNRIYMSKTQPLNYNIWNHSIKKKTLTHYDKYLDQNQEEDFHLVKAPSAKKN